MILEQSQVGGVVSDVGDYRRATVAFMFTGQGSQSSRMGMGQYESDEVFRGVYVGAI